MKVWVTNYQHRHGEAIVVYATKKLAEEAREGIAVEWWDREIGNTLLKPTNLAELADAYFDFMADRDEWFYIEEHDVIGL